MPARSKLSTRPRQITRSRTTSSRPKRSASTARADRVRLALVGCGGMGHVHAHHMLANPGIEVVAICDPSRAALDRIRTAAFGPKGAKPSEYTRYDQLLDRAKLDGVVLVTPHADHYPQVCAAFDAGLHVLCEKPLVTQTDHARELVRRSAKARRLLSVGFNSVVSAEFPYIANLIRRGELGEIQFITGQVNQQWLHFTRGTWRLDPAVSGGGFLFDTGAHMLNAMIWLMDQPVKRVYARLDYLDQPVEINAAVTLTFAGGGVANGAFAGNVPGPIDSMLSLHGTRGMVRTGIWGNKLEHWDADGNLVKYPPVVHPPSTPTGNFADAILGRDQLRCPGRYGVILGELMDAIYTSAKTGCEVEVVHRPE